MNVITLPVRGASREASRSLRLDETPRYHRNGVGGDGFFAVRFSWKSEGCWSQLVAVVSPYGDDTPIERVFVFDSSDLARKFDGCFFAPWLIEMCKAASKNGSAHRGETP